MIKQFNEYNVEQHIDLFLSKYKISREEYFKNDILDNKNWLEINKKEKNLILQLNYLFKPIFPSLNKIYDKYYNSNVSIEMFKTEDDYYYIGLGINNIKKVYSRLNQYYKLDQFVELKRFLFILKKYNLYD